MNVTKPDSEERLAEHHALFQKIWKSFLKNAEACYQYGGKIAFEWPTDCAYWKWPMVIDFVRQYQLNTVKLNGCAVGLKSDEGLPMVRRATLRRLRRQSPWTLTGKCPVTQLGHATLNKRTFSPSWGVSLLG
eukprot:8712937-Heterocapsa_arctica.AAC.1